jgi:hypothetical protein
MLGAAVCVFIFFRDSFSFGKFTDDSDVFDRDAGGMGGFRRVYNDE